MGPWSRRARRMVHPMAKMYTPDLRSLACLELSFAESISKYSTLQACSSPARCFFRIDARCHEYPASFGVHQDRRHAGGYWSLRVAAAVGGIRGLRLLTLPRGFRRLRDRSHLREWSVRVGARSQRAVCGNSGCRCTAYGGVPTFSPIAQAGLHRRLSLADG